MMKKSIFVYSLTAVLLVSIATSSSAWALGWHDTEWTGLGCPSKLSGDWVPLTDSPYAGVKIEFKSDGAALSSKENNRVFFSFFPNSMKDEKFISLQRVSEDSAFLPRVLKIRPHLAIQSDSKGKKYTLCKIKVFLFESEQKAKQMSYMSWDIYSTIDSIEVRHGN